MIKEENYLEPVCFLINNFFNLKIILLIKYIGAYNMRMYDLVLGNDEPSMSQFEKVIKLYSIFKFENLFYYV